MTTRKTILVVSAISIGVAVCLSVWFVLHKAGSPSTGAHPTAAHNDPTPKHAPQPNKRLDIGKALRQKAALMKADYIESGASSPRTEKMIEIMESPEYIAFMENSIKNITHDDVFNFGQKEVDFLESQGLVYDFDMSSLFRANFPTGEPADYEPEMREKAAQLFLTTELNPQHPQAARSQRLQVLTQFTKTEGGHSWFLGQFGYKNFLTVLSDTPGNPASEWLIDVQRNASSIVAAANGTDSESPETEASAPSWDMSSVMESPPTETAGDRQGASAPSALDVPAMPTLSPDAASSQSPSVPDIPQGPTAVPTAAGLEAALKSQFSSARSDQAMDTLERYGQEEGLRRLRESDPAVAEQIERQHKSEDVPR